VPCTCEKPTCPGDGGGYYVTVVNGMFTGFLLGPYDTHVEALAQVGRGNDLACKADPRAHWYAFGTARITDPAVRTPKTVFGK
jgi:hypothetical protein